MKTKIFVCSNSGIDYIPHDGSIGSIPVILKISEEEEYDDYSDVSTDAFYNRIRMDKGAELKFKSVFQNYSKIIEYVSQAKEKGYEQVLFILASKNFSSLYVPVSIAISSITDIPCTIYSSNLCCYPLAYMAIEASAMFENGKSIEEVIEVLNCIQRNSHVFFFNPKNTDETDPSFLKTYSIGKLSTLENGKLVTLTPKHIKNALEQMIQQFCIEIKDKEVIPFILYTTKNSKYIHLIEQLLSREEMNFKKIKVCAIPPAVGMQTGIYSVALGYIIKNNE